jgi:hypothetical protein
MTRGERLFGRVVRRVLLPRAKFLERYGVQLVPDHFYYPVPSAKALTPELFQRTSDCPGIDWNVKGQEATLRTVVEPYRDEVEPDYALRMISCMDALIYYAMIRRYKPRKVIEIGSGESTRYAALACARNRAEAPCQLVCVEPFPSAELRSQKGLTRLLEANVQAVDFGEFLDCDLLFIDSSHVLKIGSDVVWELLEIVPRLKRGCLVHWHDMFLPGEYLEEWVKKDRLFWNEQYAVQAFLMFNQAFEILWASQFMARRDPEGVRKALGRHARHDYPVSSLWARRLD